MKKVRQVAVPDRLWSALGALAESLGTDREALLQQALHAFLRFHGALPAEPPAAARPAPADPEPATRGAGPTGSDANPIGGGPVTLEGVEPGHPGAPAPGRAASARRVLDTARELERAMAPGTGTRRAPRLTVEVDQGAPIAVDRDRFLIGRGRHCDLVVESAKVSREHAVLRREGDAWWIEDLGSSNGTWHDRSRIDRRRIADGDEYLISSAQIRCMLG